MPALTSRTAGYGPVCPVVWEGHPVRGVPIPILLIPYIIKQIVGWDLSQKDLHSVLRAKGCNYPAYGANFQGFGLNTWIDEEPLPGLWNFAPSIFL